MGSQSCSPLQRCLGLRATLALCAITAVARRLSKRAVPLAITAGAIVMQTGGVDCAYSVAPATSAHGCWTLIKTASRRLRRLCCLCCLCCNLKCSATAFCPCHWSPTLHRASQVFLHASMPPRFGSNACPICVHVLCSPLPGGRDGTALQGLVGTSELRQLMT